VRPTQPVENFGNISVPFGTLAIHSPPGKILLRSSEENLLSTGLNVRGVAEYSDFVPIEGYISETVQNRRLVSVTNRKSHIIMSLRLVPKSMTLNDLERRSPNLCVILQNSVAFGAD